MTLLIIPLLDEQAFSNNQLSSIASISDTIVEDDIMAVIFGIIEKKL